MRVWCRGADQRADPAALTESARWADPRPPPGPSRSGAAPSPRLMRVLTAPKPFVPTLCFMLPPAQAGTALILSQRRWSGRCPGKVWPPRVPKGEAGPSLPGAGTLLCPQQQAGRAPVSLLAGGRGAGPPQRGRRAVRVPQARTLKPPPVGWHQEAGLWEAETSPLGFVPLSEETRGSSRPLLPQDVTGRRPRVRPRRVLTRTPPCCPPIFPCFQTNRASCPAQSSGDISGATAL